MKKQFHELLLIARTKSGFNQRELAKRAKTTQPHICNLESGRIDPSLSMLLRLAKAMSISSNELRPE